MLNFFSRRNAQVTIFIIVAVLAIAGVALYFVLTSEEVSQEDLSPELREPENAFLSCIKSEARSGVELMKTQAGYIDTPEFERGSRYMPFSSHLNFAGTSVPYWKYISGNNFERENVPSKKLMEKQLASFVQEQVRENCRLRQYRQGEYNVERGEVVNASVNIYAEKVEINVEMDLAISKGEQRAVVEEHTETVDTNLGSLFDAAKKVYQYEQENQFLEKYGVDVLYSYAPVTGTELSCSPKTWNANDVFDELESALQSNAMALKNSGSGDDYYNVDLPVQNRVNFMTLSSWPSTFEVNPSEGPTMVAEPLGDEIGMGSLGFCFVNYHFVYDMKYPVMVQVSEEGETFQFPVAVVIEGNTPGPAENGSYGDRRENQTPDNLNLCENKNTAASVKTLGLNNEPVNASVSYSCFGEVCRIGQASDGNLQNDFPQCANGFVVARAEGYETVKRQFSTVQGNKSITVYMEKLHNLSLDFNVDGSSFEGQATINFVSEDSSETVVLPGQENVQLSEGNYNVSAYVYENTSLKFEDVSSQQCVDVPTGVPGVTNERCFDLDIPSGASSRALTGGGQSQKVFLNSDLESANTITVNAPSLPEPESVDDVRRNYDQFESKSLDISLE
ncbi:MAG: hypothetical protein ABEI74_01775 [Candidatus Pacearchaeota archaeon]